jgi:hypothetical protein
MCVQVEDAQFSAAKWDECYASGHVGERMSSQKLWIWAALGDLLVGIGSLAIHGFTVAAAGSATRNTARFAICFLLTGFAAPGLRKWFEGFPDPTNLIRAYMAAQFVHFAFVINLHTTFADSIQIGIPQIVISLLGFSLVAVTGYTASAGSRVGVRIHTVLLYINWLILAADYSKHPIKFMRLAAIPVFLALILRWLPRPKAQDAKTASA